MGIIIKFLLKNIYEKKFRTLLIVIAVMLSSALYFASSTISGTMTKMYLERMKQVYGTTEILVTANEKSPTGFIDPNNARQHMSELEYVVGMTQGSGVFNPSKNETVNISLTGIDLDALKQMTSLSLKEVSNLYPFDGHKVIINVTTAKKYNLHLGDDLKLKMNNQLVRFQICAIANPVGAFVDDGRTTNAVLPQSTLNALYGERGKSTALCIKTKDPAKINELIKALSKDYSRYTVREPFSKEDLAKEMGDISTPFMLMTIIVSFMSIFIIYSSFKVLTLERLPVIGTFRSIGATRRTTDLVMLAESTIYGIIGGALGCLLGIGILYYMSSNSIFSAYDSNFKATLQFSPSQLIGTFIMAVILCFVSSILPILKVSKIPVKEIVLNAIERKSRKKRWKPILGAFMLAFSILMPRIAPPGPAVLIDAASMLFAVISVVLLIPILTGIFIRLFERVYTIIFGNIGILAAKNLRENKSVLNSISLLTIGISSLLMINTVTYSVLTEITSYFTKNAKYNVYMYIDRADNNMLRRIQATDGILDVYGDFNNSRVDVKGSNEKLEGLQGINTSKYLEFNYLNLPGDQQALLNKLNDGRNILVGNGTRTKFGVDVGDDITLKVKSGERTYHIIGTFDILDYNGNLGIIADSYFKSDFGGKYFNSISIKSIPGVDPESVVKNLRAKFAMEQPWLMSMKEMERTTLAGNKQMFSQLQGFSILTLLIGILGVFNNLMLSFIERKRSLAMYRSTGMSKSQILKMIFIEALSGGIIGGAVGVGAGVSMVSIVPYVMTAIGSPMSISTTPSILFTGFMAGVVIMVVATISPAIKSSKLNIITSLKYE